MFGRKYSPVKSSDCHAWRENWRFAGGAIGKDDQEGAEYAPRRAEGKRSAWRNFPEREPYPSDSTRKLRAALLRARKRRLGGKESRQDNDKSMLNFLTWLKSRGKKYKNPPKGNAEKSVLLIITVESEPFRELGVRWQKKKPSISRQRSVKGKEKRNIKSQYWESSLCTISVPPVIISSTKLQKKKKS